MSDFVDKKQELRKYFPAPAYKLRDGKGLAILLDIMGGELNTFADEGQNARAQFLLATATGRYLQIHGQNVDVFRPHGYRMNDDTYRSLIRVVANTPKNIEQIFELIIGVFFGPNAIQNGLADVYSIRPNEMIVELKQNALIIASQRDLLGTTFLHQDHAGFDGVGGPLWSGVTPVDLTAHVSKGFTFGVVPAGMPTAGSLKIGTETKGFVRSGAIVTFFSAVQNDYAAGTAIEGPVNPSDYPSGYLYDRQIRSDLVGAYAAGVGAVTVGSNVDLLPAEGTCYIGKPANANFEAKGFARVGGVLTLKGTLGFAHSAGDDVILPNMPRKIRTQLNQNITAGQSFATLTVVNAANFPVDRAALVLHRSFANAEIIPFTSRVVGDNTKIQVDPGYTFRFDHASGEAINLMARRTTPTQDGLMYPFYLNDTDALRTQYFNLLRRVKALGVKIVFELI